MSQSMWLWQSEPLISKMSDEKNKQALNIHFFCSWPGKMWLVVQRYWYHLGFFFFLREMKALGPTQEYQTRAYIFNKTHSRFIHTGRQLEKLLKPSFKLLENQVAENHSFLYLTTSLKKLLSKVFQGAT